MKKWKRISTEVINKNPWTEFLHDRFETPDGRQGDYYYMKTPVGSVLIVPLLDDGRLVLHREYRYLFDRISLEFPAGGIKIEQSPEQAARAELQEETGYTVNHLEEIQKIAPGNGLFLEYTHVFLAKELTAGETSPDEFEEFEPVLMTVGEVDAAIQTGEIWDGFSLSAWCLVRQRVLDILEKNL
ncbi:MAG: NUDIX hydrolase [Parcubacteria group bacterium]|nr:NUDIX hydrolase [Parcubacteria group bacterium]